MEKSLKHYGKIIPSSCATVLVSLYGNHDFIYPIYNYITTEVFNYQCITEDRCKWFCTYPFGIDSLCLGAKILEAESIFLTSEKTFDDRDDLFLAIEKELGKGSFILGPIDTSPIWDAAESHFFKGYAQFVYVVGIQDKQYILHDPNGCPNLKISSDLLWAMVKNHGTIYFAKFDLSRQPCQDLEKFYMNIFTNIINNRLKMIESPHNYLRGMQKLCVQFKEQGIRSSDLMSLRYTLLYVSRSLYLLNEFIRSYKYYLNRFDNKIISSLNELLMITEEYSIKLNPFCMNTGIDKNIEKIISIQALYEQDLNEIAKKLKNQVGDIDD